MISLLNAFLRWLKKDPDYGLDPALAFGDVVGMLVRLKLGLLRGLWIRPWLRGARGVQFIHPGAKISNWHCITLGRNVVAEPGCEIQGLSKRGVTLGDQTTIGRLSMIRPSGYYGREIGEGFSLGDRSNVGPYCYIGCAGYIEIGKDVLMGPRVGLFAENHVFDDPYRTIRSQGVNRQGIVIEDDCWLGSGSIILDGVRVGRGSVVAAGSVVTKDVPPNSVVGGVPAKVLKTRGAIDGA